MAMTTPVISSKASMFEKDKMKMSFVMPSKFWASDTEAPSQTSGTVLASAPTPMEGSGVMLEEKGGGYLGEETRVAVIWFGGYATKEEVAARTNQLMAGIEADNGWVPKQDSEPFLMQVCDHTHSAMYIAKKYSYLRATLFPECPHCSDVSTNHFLFPTLILTPSFSFSFISYLLCFSITTLSSRHGRGATKLLSL
jgi:hypothetical protein